MQYNYGQGVNAVAALTTLYISVCLCYLDLLQFILGICHCRLPVDVVVGAGSDRVGDGAAVEHPGPLRARRSRDSRPAHAGQRRDRVQDEEVPGHTDDTKGPEN